MKSRRSGKSQSGKMLFVRRITTVGVRACARVRA